MNVLHEVVVVAKTLSLLIVLFEIVMNNQLHVVIMFKLLLNCVYQLSLSHLYSQSSLSQDCEAIIREENKYVDHYISRKRCGPIICGNLQGLERHLISHPQ